MKQLVSIVVFGCTLLVPGLAASKRSSKAPQTVPVYEMSESEPVPVVDAAGYYSGDAVAQSEPQTGYTSICCSIKKRPKTKWTQILAAPKSQCGLYTFVQSGICSAGELCASLGLVVPNDCKLPGEVQCCATKCGFKSSGKHFNPCRRCKSDSSDSHSDSSSESTKGGLVNWKHGCKNATVCMQPMCKNCQSPQLLTFDDGTDQTCSLFLVDPDIPSKDTVYRGFSITNGGVFDPWANRCLCTFPSTLSSVVSQQKVLINAIADAPMEFYRDEPFTLISMFVSFSSTEANSGTVKISVFKDGKSFKLDPLRLVAGVPTLVKPSSPICDIVKIRFEFEPSMDHKYVVVDNMLLCM